MLVCQKYVTRFYDSQFEVIMKNTSDWDCLPDYVGITDNVGICEALSRDYQCVVPICCVEVVPGNYIPEFDACIMVRVTVFTFYKGPRLETMSFCCCSVFF